MKKSKIFMLSGFLIATIGAFAFRPATPLNNQLLETRYKNIQDCPGVQCGSSGSASCNGFYQQPNCSQPANDDLLYTP